MIESPSLLLNKYNRSISESSSSKFRRLSDNSRLPTSFCNCIETSYHKTNENGKNAFNEFDFNSKILKIDSPKLAEEISYGNSLIIIDLRSAYNFTRLHIKTAKLANCTSKMTSRRAVHLVDEILKSSKYPCRVILYNEMGLTFNQEDPSSILINFLNIRSVEYFYLTGGINKFKSTNPKLCESGSSNILCLQIPNPTSNTSNVYLTKASMILPFLYIGNEFDAVNGSSMASHGITHVLNLTLKSPFLDEIKFKSKRICCNDTQIQDLVQYFDEAFNFIELARLTNGKVLVHCQAGISRSATIVIAYLMSHCQDLDLNSAHQLVKTRRSIISPNFNFMGQLIQYENDLSDGTIKRNCVLNVDTIVVSNDT